MEILMQSERSRKNLYKWLGMYIAVLLLFTTVVTYSKYITKLSSSDDARVASFNMDIDYQNVNGCKAGNNEECLVGKYRPTSEIPYYFTVDTSGLEVRTFFVLSVNVPYPYEIVRITRLEDKKVVTPTEGNSEELNRINLSEVVEASKGKKLSYELVIRYNGGKIVEDEDGNSYYDENAEIGASQKDESLEKVVTVDYSMDQITVLDNKNVTIWGGTE